jgi:hypothetical protein
MTEISLLPSVWRNDERTSKPITGPSCRDSSNCMKKTLRISPCLKSLCTAGLMCTLSIASQTNRKWCWIRYHCHFPSSDALFVGQEPIHHEETPTRDRGDVSQGIDFRPRHVPTIVQNALFASSHERSHANPSRHRSYLGPCSPQRRRRPRRSKIQGRGNQPPFRNC